MPGRWDESLYAGTAEFYRDGRMPYPERIATALQHRLGLDADHGALLDLGCGPGALTFLLAPLFAEAVAVDADADMIRVGQDEAERRRVANVRWLHGFDEDVEDGFGQFTVVTLAQSFTGWTGLWSQPRSGVCSPQAVIACTWERRRIRACRTRLVCRIRSLPGVACRNWFAPISGRTAARGSGSSWKKGRSPMRTRFFELRISAGPEEIDVPGGDALVRTRDQIVASVLSLSSSAPHLFGDPLANFVDDLRRVLREASPDGRFSEQLREMRLSLWHAG